MMSELFRSKPSLGRYRPQTKSITGTICICPAIVAVLAACAPTSAPTLPPVASLTSTIAAPTATIVPPTLTPALPTPTFTRIPVTPTPSLTPTLARPSNEPPPQSITLILKPEPNAVTATFTARGEQSVVELNVQSSASGIAQSASIFEAFCAQPGITRYTLTNVANGKSLTTLNVPLPTLMSGALNLDVKNSTRPADGSLACIAIPEAWFIKLDEGAQPGTVVAFSQAGGTEIDMFLKPGPPGAAQPAFIRTGKCNDLGSIRYSLNPIVDGVSKTFFGVRFVDFKKEKGALNVHKSIQDLDISVACGLIAPEDVEGRGR